MTEPWCCQGCSFRTLEPQDACRHSNAFGHVVRRKLPPEQLTEGLAVAKRAAPAPPQRWVCEECPYETHEQHRAEGHETEHGHTVVLATNAKSHPQRELATPETTGPGAILTDGADLLEVIDCRRRKIKAGERMLGIAERRLVDVTHDDDDDKEPGAWVPFADVKVLEVVKPVAYDEPYEQS